MATDNNHFNNNDPNRFTHQSSTAEDLLKSQTVGLVQLSDFRKRRAEVLEQKEREAQEYYLAKGRRGDVEGKATSSTETGGKKKKVKRANGQSHQGLRTKSSIKGKLSFANDEEDDGFEAEQSQKPKSTTTMAPSDVSDITSQSMQNQKQESPGGQKDSAIDSASPEPAVAATINNSNCQNTQQASVLSSSSTNKSAIVTTNAKPRLGPNRTLAVQPPKIMTKSALLRDAQLRDHLRKEFLAMQTAVRATEIAIPFVFYDGINIPGGVCRVKKGDHVWMYLDRARKVGARNGVRGGGDRSKKQWARVGVDDLLLVRGGIIIPHHYEFYHFILNKTIGFHGPLFKYSAQPTAATPSTLASDDANGDDDDDKSNLSSFAPLSRPGSKKSHDDKFTYDRQQQDSFPIEELEGFKDDPNMTKVVDRRWYERNKHIFPASIWEDFDPDKDFSKEIPKDAHGNSFFFS